MPDTLAGFPVRVDRHLCQPVFVRWRRTNRRARIRKKWRKKYGAVCVCPGFAFEVQGMGFLVCPCIFAKLQEAVP